MTLITSLISLLLASVVAGESGADGPITPAATIADCDAPLLFAYGSWEGRVRTAAGHALLRGQGVSPRGGAGCNAQVNLKGHEDDCPALSLRTGAKNTGKMIRLLLRDTSDRAGNWDFALPAPSTSFHLVPPRNGESLSQPTTVEKTSAPDL